MGKREWIVTIGFIIVIAILSVIVFWQKRQSAKSATKVKLLLVK